MLVVKKIWEERDCEVILISPLGRPKTQWRRTTSGRWHLRRGGGLHDRPFQPFSKKVRRPVGEAQGRGSGGHPFAPVLQACATFQHRRSQSHPFGLRDRLLVPRPGTWWKARGGGVLRHTGPRRLYAG